MAALRTWMGDEQLEPGGTKFFLTSADGTRVRAWRNDGQGIPVVISNGLGTPPAAWPTLIGKDSGYRVCTWYYRGTHGGSRPAERSHVRIADHVADLLALMDHEGIERAVIPCWSIGVNVAFEFARAYPERVAGLLAVAGVPGGTFRAMFGPLRVPRPLRHDVGVAVARLMRATGGFWTWLGLALPLTDTTARVLNHTGFVLPRARPERLLPMLYEFRQNDFRWFFTLAVAAAEHQPMDLAFVQVPVTLVAGRYDVLTAMQDMVEAAARIPHAELKILPGSHFLPLEFPTELAELLGELAERSGLSGAAAPRRSGAPRRAPRQRPGTRRRTT